MRTGLSRTLVLMVLLAVAGCRAELVHDLDEHEANEVLLALDEAGIGAWKSRTSANYEVEVAESELPRALRVLERRGLPHPAQNSWATTFGETSLIATPEEERARLMSALSGELSRTLGALPGVIDARVHVALPSRPTALDEAARPASASVLLRVTDGATIDETSTRALIARAVEGLAPSDIHITRLEVEREAPVATLENVGPFAVARGSSTPLRGALALLLLTNVLLAASVGWMGMRSRRR